MSDNTERNGSEIQLTGNQVRFIRNVVGESQAKFSKRFAVSPATIFRLEAKGDGICTGPDIILISQLYERYKIVPPGTLPTRGPSVTSSDGDGDGSKG